MGVKGGWMRCQGIHGWLKGSEIDGPGIHCRRRRSRSRRVRRVPWLQIREFAHKRVNDDLSLQGEGREG